MVEWFRFAIFTQMVPDTFALTAPYLYQGIKAMNQQALKPAYNYLDFISAPKQFYDMLGKY